MTHSKKTGGRVNATGRNQSSPFFKVPWWLYDNPAVLSLSGNGLKVWLHLIRQYNGRNNGDIGMSARRLEADIGISKTTAVRALKELRYHGLIVIVEKSGFQNPLATTFRLTHLPTEKDAATHDYKQWCPKTKQLIAH